MGFPTFEETGNNLLNFEEYLIENPHASFLTKMQSNNLAPVNILKGDLVIIERCSQANAGDLVLVIEEGHHIFLRAELTHGIMTLRSVFDGALHHTTVQIMGVIKGVIRKY